MDWHDSSPTMALTHLDGRNAHKVASLRPYFSEFAWMKKRLLVMTEYVTSLVPFLTGRSLSSKQKKDMHIFTESFSLADAKQVAAFERTTNHDLKALELFLAARMKRSSIAEFIYFINLGIGSEDVNSIALALIMKTSRGEVLLPALVKVVKCLTTLASKEKHTVMVARTHGQPANITTFGKEVANSLSRLCDEINFLSTSLFSAKCSGEIGSYQAFLALNSRKDWLQFTDSFIHSLGLEPVHTATQIAPYDRMICYLQSIYRCNGILLDFAKNMWLYVLLGYLRVNVVEKEVGSAGMPHKVNPIYFEGAEGGLETANGIIELLVRKFPMNRLQRDFSDSTMRRNIVLPLAYSLLSYQSIVEALARIDVNREAIDRDVHAHAEIWTETVKAYGLMHGIRNMYDRLKRATRGRVVSEKDLTVIVRSLPLKESEKKELLVLCNGTKNPYPARIVDETVNRANRL